MTMNKLFKSLLTAALFLTGGAQATELPADVSFLASQLNVPLEDIRPAPIAGWYELLVDAQVFYLTADGKYLMAGNLIEVASKKNLTDERLKSVRMQAVSQIGDDQLIAYKASRPAHTVTVFTDIDCGYCRKLHAQMDEYNNLGISINYLLYPRSGPGTPSFDKAISVWCNTDRNTALTDAKAGKSIAVAKCTNPVARHFQLGTEVGVRGTPHMITESGDALPGYLSPADLKRQLGKLQAIAGG